MALGDEFKGHGITEATPGNIVLGAGTIHAGLEFTAGSGGSGGTWNAAESIIGATSGGNKLTIAPEITDIEVDGAMVKVEGLAVKTSETATLEVNLVEITGDILKKLVIAKDEATTDKAGYSGIQGKARVEAGDYIENFGFVGKRIDGQPIIIIFDKALCNTGLEWDAKAKEAGVLAATFECYAPITGDLESLPWHIYYPTPQAEIDLQGDDI